MSRTSKSEKLKGFVWLDHTAFAPHKCSEAVFVLGLGGIKSAGFEMDDPTASGKRDRHIEYLIHDGKVWKTTWMDRTGNYAIRGKKQYGVKELKGAPICEFL